MTMAYKDSSDEPSDTIPRDLRSAILWATIFILTAIIVSNFDFRTAPLSTSFAIAIWLVAAPILGVRLVRIFLRNRTKTTL
jgi:membrane protein DedA with SNARE-associated domain